MTRINKIVMNGFKSFAKKTELTFGKRFNCILGPNGSGKSNVLDALCFVLGKGSAKGLRVEKATNLVYNGGKSKNPAKQGEVSIYFDNSNKVFPLDDKEIKITRIVRKSGQSVYKINNRTRTRAQVLDLLSVARINPDGYNIILQGDIIRFVEMSLEKRRLVIEEISGISVYEEKKQKALNELNKVEAKIQESEIIMGERKVHLKELKADRDQAIKYKHVDDDMKRVRATLLFKQIEDKEKKLEKLNESADKNRKTLESLNIKVKEGLDKIEQKRKEIRSITSEIEKKGEKEQLQIQKQIETLKIELATNKERITNVRTEIERIRQRKEDLARSRKDIIDKVVSQESLIKEKEEEQKRSHEQLLSLKKTIDEFKKKNKLDVTSSFEQDIEKLDKLADQKQEEISSLREEQQNLFRERDSLEMQINSLDDKISKVKEIEESNRTELKNLKSKKDAFKKAASELSQLLNEDQKNVQKLGAAKADLASAEERLSRMKTQQSHLMEKVSKNLATEKILDSKSQIKGVHDTVNNLGQVSKKYSLALEIAAGPRIKSIVVDDDSVAAKCIRFLKDNKYGVATFLPLNKIRSGTGFSDDKKRLLDFPGVLGFATDIVTYEPQYKKVFAHVFGETLIVKDINTARKIGIGKARMVTLDGDLMEVSGAMHGGYRQKERKYGFRQDELMKDVEQLESKIAQYQSLVSNLKSIRQNNEERITRLRHEKANLEGDIITMEKSLHLDSSDLESSRKVKKELQEKFDKAEKELDAITERISQLNKDLASLKMKKQELRQEMTELRNPRLLAELNTYEQKKEELTVQNAEMSSEIKNLKMQIETILSPELESSDKIMKQHDRETKDFEEEIKALREQIKNQEKEVKEKEEYQKSFYKQFQSLFSKRDKLQEEITRLESVVKENEFRIKDIENRLNNISMDNTRITAEHSALKQEYEQFRDYEKLKGIGLQELQSRLSALNSQIARMGNVNMRALEVYDKLEKEFRYLEEKRETLLSEKEDVISMMDEIESKKKDLFMKSFNRVNDHFKRIFAQLSTKGDAYLELENEKSPFEGGVRINVRLTGKKFLDIRSLSGGEKTLTALAFIFAIQEDNPASFYVLDEVDAALDKRNSEKLSQLVNKYSSRSQYIVISHNDGVISSAESLYGVSMDKNGMSKVVSLKI